MLGRILIQRTMIIMVCDQSLSLRFAIATGQAGADTLECELDFLPHLLTEFGLDGIEFRLVGNGRTVGVWKKGLQSALL